MCRPTSKKQVFFGGGAALDHFWWLRLAPDSISEHTDNEALAMIKNREATIDEFIVVRGCCMWPKTENFSDESMGYIKSFSYKIAENSKLQELLDQGHMAPVCGLGPHICKRLLEMAQPPNDGGKDVDLGVDVWEGMATATESSKSVSHAGAQGGVRNNISEDVRNNIVNLDMKQTQDVQEKLREELADEALQTFVRFYFRSN